MSSGAGDPTGTTSPALPSPPPWRPVFEGAEAERLRTLIAGDGAAAVAALLGRGAGFDLANGACGAAIVLTELARACLGEALPSADDALSRAATIAAAQVSAAERGEARRVWPGLWQGVAGLRWTQLHLGRGDHRSQYDEELLLWCQRPKRLQWDLVAGVAGVGVLGLELAAWGRGEALVDAAIERLAALATEDADGVSWASTAAEHRPDERNLGLAHGQPGVIGFLASAIERPGARSLLAASTSWLLSRVQPRPAISSLAHFSPGRADRTEVGRLAWCYGDAGAAIALVRAGGALGDAGVADRGRDIAIRATERTRADAGIRDASLCHGAAGVGHLFGRLWQLTGEERCRSAAMWWLRVAVELRLVPGVDALYPAWDPALPGMLESGFHLLTGAGGVCLALVAATAEGEPSWDRIMLAS